MVSWKIDITKNHVLWMIFVCSSFVFAAIFHKWPELNELNYTVLLIAIFSLPFLVQFYEWVFLNIFDKFLDCKPPKIAQVIVIFDQFQLDTHCNLVWEAKFLSKLILKKLIPLGKSSRVYPEHPNVSNIKIERNSFQVILDSEFKWVFPRTLFNCSLV